MWTKAVMSRDDKRRLIRAVFDTPLASGTPAGVYIYPDTERPSLPHRPKSWTFKVRGRLEFELVMQNARQCRGR
jgi:hypothetical protein